MQESVVGMLNYRQQILAPIHVNILHNSASFAHSLYFIWNIRHYLISVYRANYRLCRINSVVCSHFASIFPCKNCFSPSKKYFTWHLMFDWVTEVHQSRALCPECHCPVPYACSLLQKKLDSVIRGDTHALSDLHFWPLAKFQSKHICWYYWFLKVCLIRY
jgi:hypothetical protein